MAGMDTFPTIDYTHVSDDNKAKIEALEAAVRRHPAAAAGVLKAAGAILATNAYTELNFDERSEEVALSQIKPRERLAAAPAEAKGRIIAANVIEIAAVWAKLLAEALDDAA